MATNIHDLTERIIAHPSMYAATAKCSCGGEFGALSVYPETAERKAREWFDLHVRDCLLTGDTDAMTADRSAPPLADEAS